MQRTYRHLKPAQVTKRAKEGIPGMYPDGDGLYLQISKAGVPSWGFRYMIAGRARLMGLGPLRDVTLKQARELAYEARQLKRQGIDPLEARREKRLGAAVKQAKTVTFEQCAQAYIVTNRAGWRSPKHARQWVQTLETYVYPVCGALPVEAIDTNLVMQVLDPIWHAKPATAMRVRGRIETVLDWAKARGHRNGENPARWKGHLANLLPEPSKIAPTKHHPALPYREIAGFVAELRQHDDAGARALELLILTKARSKEILQAPWSEFDLEQRLWTVVPERMKGGREHRVPLSDAALAILEQQKAVRSNDYVFPGAYGAKHLGTNALLQVLQRLGRADLTAHGFRSTFTDWCAEVTTFPVEVRKMALAHKIPDAVEEAYRRGDLFQKRCDLAEAWASYISGGTVVSFPGIVRQSA